MRKTDNMGRESDQADLTDETILYQGDGDQEPSKASTVAPPGQESEVQASSGGEESSTDEAVVVVKTKNAIMLDNTGFRS